MVGLELETLSLRRLSLKRTDALEGVAQVVLQLADALLGVAQVLAQAADRGLVVVVPVVLLRVVQAVVVALVGVVAAVVVVRAGVLVVIVIAHDGRLQSRSLQTVIRGRLTWVASVRQ